MTRSEKRARLSMRLDSLAEEVLTLVRRADHLGILSAGRELEWAARQAANASRTSMSEVPRHVG